MAEGLASQAESQAQSARREAGWRPRLRAGRGEDREAGPREAGEAAAPVPGLSERVRGPFLFLESAQSPVILLLSKRGSSVPRL